VVQWLRESWEADCLTGTFAEPKRDSTFSQNTQETSSARASSHDESDQHTNALTGNNGKLGGAILTRLLPSVDQGQIHLVVLHRPTSSLDGLPSNVKTREIDLADTDERIGKAVEGVNILM